MPQRPTITGLVLTYNGARLLEPCLKSLAFCSDILVVDSFSKDDTMHIAQQCRARVIQNKWPGPKAQFEFALTHVTTDWVVTIDQDEIISPALRDAILETLPTAGDHCGYYVSRSSWYHDRFMRYSGWYPDWLLRVFRRDGAVFTQSGAHEHIRPKGKAARLRPAKAHADILHYPYENFRQHLDKINDYAQKGAEDLQARGKRGGILVGMGHALGRFLKLFIVKRGFLDGRAGFLNACHGAFYAFLKYARVNEGTWGAPYNHRLKEPESNASNATPTPKEGRK